VKSCIDTKLIDMKYHLIKTIALMAIVCANAHAQSIPINERTDFYSIDGSNTSELRASIRANRPNLPNMGNYDAYTDWKVHYGYSIKKTMGRCRLTKPVVRVMITFVMPRFVGVKSAPHSMRYEWERYYRELKKHENGHRDIAVEAAHAIKAMLTNLGSVSGCSKLERLVNERANELTQRYHRRQADFDRDTDHGRATGAVLR